MCTWFRTRIDQLLGTKLKDLITIVSYRTFLRWKQDDRTGRPPRGAGRPRTTQALRDLIVKIAQETGWGYVRRVTARLIPV